MTTTTLQDVPALRLARRLSEALALVGGAILVLIMIYTVLDVGGRYALNSPLPGSVDVVSYGLGLAVALVLPYGFTHNSHVAVTLLSDITRGRVHHAVNAVVSLISTVFMVGLNYRIAVYALDRLGSGDRMWILGLLVWPIWTAIATVLVAACVCAAVVTWSHLTLVISPQPPATTGSEKDV